MPRVRFEPTIAAFERANKVHDLDRAARPRHSSSVFSLFGLSGYWHCGHSWPIVPASGDSEDDCGEADGM
jgi:hypothetical protein